MPESAVAEPAHLGDAERGGRCRRLLAPAVDERLAVGEVVGRLAVGAVGAHDEHDPVALGRRPRHRPARQPGLVVGMGVDEHDRGHSVAEGTGDRMAV